MFNTAKNMMCKCCSNCRVLLCAGAAGACAQGEVPHPFLHVHRLREPPQTLPGAQPGQAGYSRGEGGCRKCKYTSQFFKTLCPANQHHWGMSSILHFSQQARPLISVPAPPSPPPTPHPIVSSNTEVS